MAHHHIDVDELVRGQHTHFLSPSFADALGLLAARLNDELHQQRRVGHAISSQEAQLLVDLIASRSR